MKKVTCHLFHEPVEITKALIAVASHAQTTKDCDGPEYALMRTAADKIKSLETVLGFYVQARKLEKPQTDRVWRIMSKWYNTATEDPDFKELVVDEFFDVLGQKSAAALEDEK